MRTLHLFGDSYTEGHLLDKHYPNYQLWKEFRGGNLPLCWGDLLSNKLDMRMSNHAVAGMSNSEIFQTICRHSTEFEKNDIVIINWSYPQRFRWVYYYKPQNLYQWKRLSANPEDGTYISESTRQDIAVNKTLSPYIEEVYEQEKLIKEFSKSKGFRLFFWSADIDIINNLSSEKLNNEYYLLHKEIEKIPLDFPDSLNGGCFVRTHKSKKTIFDVFFNRGGSTIYHETNGVIGDGHLGEKGHQVQYELFYKYITENTQI
jgi:hypothetical protein